ncbi:hydroxycarboxylic acid receptor 2 [Esox lucius]|uniref:G-protein coupled receptors family 1 profile domain-containing protein n=1 Tax=Esox lucius TaxID=8010 RepID=A0AAY5K7S6_ESOLU|nr:hydroxycarboxylic acid receptor 2 [Esox lucius]
MAEVTTVALNDSGIKRFHCLSTQDLVASVLPPILILELLVGLPGNVVALWIFTCRLKIWRVNTLLLFNLVLADFLLLICLPFRIDNLFRGEHWVFGQLWCRINLFMLAVNRSASIAFMTSVAFDRYFKVVHPHHRINRMTSTQTGWLAFGIWVIVISLRIPLLCTNLLKEHGNKSLCRSFSSYTKPPLAIQIHTTVFIWEFFVPLVLLLFCSVRIAFILRQRQLDKGQKVKRAIRVVGLIVTVFVLCFFPGIATGLASVFIMKYRPYDCDSYNLASQLFSLSIGFTYLNSALDPVIYCFSSSMFRNSLKSSINQLGFVEMRLSRRGSMTSDG